MTESKNILEKSKDLAQQALKAKEEGKWLHEAALPIAREIEKTIRLCAWKAKSFIENEAFDLQDIRNGYIEAKKTGRHAGGRRISLEQATLYASQFDARSDALYLIADKVEEEVLSILEQTDQE